MAPVESRNKEAGKVRLAEEVFATRRSDASADSRSHRAQMLAWLPVLLLLGAMVVLWVAYLRTAWPMPPLLLFIHVGSIAIGVVLILIPAARGFLANGQLSVLMLGCGVLMTDIGVGAWTVWFAQDLDKGFAVYNTSALLSALCHFAGVSVSSRSGTRLGRSAAWLAVVYAGGTAVMGLVIWATHAGWMPPFFIEGQGSTALRGLVVGVAVALFVLTAVLLLQSNRRTPSPFLHWYALGLLLLAGGLAGSVLIAVKDSPLHWVTRFTQVFGMVYMCVAVMASKRKGEAAELQLEAVEEAWRENALLVRLRQQTLLGWVLRHGIAVVALAVGILLRMALTAWVGPGLPTYIVFYPAVMVAALLGGLGPGLVATALAGLAAMFWMLPPVGQFAAASPADRLGLVIFAGMGLFMSVVAELYRRNRERLATYDREALLRETQDVLRKQAELVDSARAEVIAREMLHVLRDRGGADAVPAGPISETRRRTASVAGAVVATVGLMVLVGWLVGLEPLKRILPGLATMKANTALCLAAAGMALAFRERRAVRLGCAGLVCAVTGLTLAEYITGADFGIDQLLFHDRVDAHTVLPGRMVQATALGLLLGGASLLLLDARARAALWAQQVLAMGAALIGGVAVLGYVYNVEQLYRFAGYSSMALHTAVSLTVLAAGLFFARSGGIGAMLTNPGPGTQLLRRMLPGVLLTPAVLGWFVTRGSGQGLFGEGMDIVLLILAMIASLTALVFWGARALNRIDVARRDTEAQLRNLAEVMDHAHEPLIVREPGGVIRTWNHGAEALYGWTAADALGRRTHEMLRTEGVPVTELDAQLTQTGRWEGELVHITRDGRRVTVESRQTASRTPDGRVFILESSRDITERKRAEAEVRENEARFRAAFDEGAVPMVLASLDMKLLKGNAAYCRMLGFGESELIGRSFMEFTHPDDLGVNRAGVERLASGETSTFRMEKRYIRKDGTVIWVDLSTASVRDDQGRPTYLVTHVQDITDRKEAADALRKSRERLQSVLDNSLDCIYRFDLHSDSYEYISPSAEKLVEYSSEELRELTGGTALAMVHPDDQPALRAAIERLGETGEVEAEYRQRNKSGNYRWLANHMSLTRDSEGRPLYRDGTVRDITERKRAEMQLEDTRFLLTEGQRIAHMGSWQFLADTQETIWSDEECRIYGLPPGSSSPPYEVMMKEFIHPDYRELLDKTFREALRAGTVFELEHRIVRADGSVRVLADLANPYFDANGNLVKYVGTTLDIT